MTNPLAPYIRSPKLYVKLPSLNQFYDPNSIETSINGEIAVYPLSAIDQILLKTPDAMLNGESLIKVVGHCVPGVKNIRQLVEPDINTLLLAIKIASSGSTTELDVQCPNCQAPHTFDIDLSGILDNQTVINEDDTVLQFDDNLVLHLRPYNFEQRNLQMLNEIQESQTLRILNEDTELDEIVKVAKLGQQVDDMSNRTFDVVAKSIASITILKNEQGKQQEVTDQSHISEWLKGISSAQANIIINRIRELNQTGIKTDNDFRCDKCEHEWSQPIDFDPTSFFG